MSSVNGCQVKSYGLSNQQRLRFDHPGHRLQAEVPSPDLPLVGDLEQDGTNQASRRRAIRERLPQRSSAV